MANPIKLKTHKVLIKAPCELVFQKMSSFGRGRLKGDNNESSRVICRDDNHLVAEFKTKAGPFSYTTIEEIHLEPPKRITFKHLKGPLHFAQEEFIFRDVDGDTELEHRGEFIWHWFPIIGWLAGRLYTKPMFERTIRKHMQQILVSCEERASRSHVFARRGAANSG